MFGKKVISDGTSKIASLPSGADVNAKIVDLSRFVTPLKEGRHMLNRRDW